MPMISVEIVLDSNGILYEVNTSGHSGYSQKGTDIVCASVSAYVQSGYILMKRLLGENVILTQNRDSAEDNVLEYRVNDYPMELADVLRGAALFMLTGLTEIQNKYREYIRLEIKNNE